MRGLIGTVALRFARHRPALIGAALLLLLAIAAAIGPAIVGTDANRIDVLAMQQAPTAAHPFGTDDIGRDVLVRALDGGRVSLSIGFLAAVVAISIGVTIGSLAGYCGGVVDALLMRFTDALMSIPTLFLLIFVTRVFGTSVLSIAIVIGALSWMFVARLVRATVLSLKEQDFVLAARALGASGARILTLHILPNTLAPILIAATLSVGHAIVMEASLSFLGLGVQPPTSNWGTMLQRSQAFLVQAPWLAIFPGFLILLTVLCVNFVGDGLRDALDPFSQSPSSTDDG
jgi:peptide/nickel transport system permease protein